MFCQFAQVSALLACCEAEHAVGGPYRFTVCVGALMRP